MTQQALNDIHDYAQRVLAALSEAEPVLARHQEHVPYDTTQALLAVRRLAEKTRERATAPFKIGVAGMVKTGKSTLVSCLIGWDSLLPRDNEACTGNITVLNLTASDDERPALESITLQYMRLSEIRECLLFMLQKAQEVIESAAGDGGTRQRRLAEVADLRSKIAGAKEEEFEDTPLYKRVQLFCDLAWRDSGKSEWRYLFWEIWNFCETCRCCARFFCSDANWREWEIDEATLESAVALPKLDKGIEEESITGAVRSLDNYRPAGGRLTPADLQVSLPIIKRVLISLKVPSVLWDFPSPRAAAGEKKLTLVDFPGLGNEQTEMRDRYLFIKENKEVHSLLVLDSPKRLYGGADAARSIRDEVHARFHGDSEEIMRRVAVVVSRFQELPLSPMEDQMRTDYLAELLDEKEPTWEKFWKKLSYLEKVVNRARETVGDDRICFISQSINLAHLSANFSRNVKLAYQRTPKSDEDNANLLNAWNDVCERLPDGRLKSALVGFAADGGLEYLKKLVNAQVRNHGLNLIVKDAAEEAGRLKHQIEVLRRSLETFNEQVEQDASVLMERLKDLREFYEAHASIGASAADAVGDGVFRLAVRPSWQGESRVGPKQLIQYELKKSIFGWQEWRGLLNFLSHGSVKIPIAERSEKSEQEIRQDVVERFASRLSEEEIEKMVRARISAARRDNTTSFAGKADDLFPPFVETVRELKKVVAEKMKEALADSLDKWVSTPKARGADAELTELEIKMFWLNESLPEESHEAEAKLTRAIVEPFFDAVSNCRVKTIQKELARELDQLIKNDWESIDAKKIFPLPLSGDDRPGLIFAWAQAGVGAQNGINHLYQILYSRDEIITRTAQVLLREVNIIEFKLQKALGVLCRTAGGKLDRLLSLEGKTVIKTALSEGSETVVRQEQWKSFLKEKLDIEAGAW